MKIIINIDNVDPTAVPAAIERAGTSRPLGRASGGLAGFLLCCLAVAPAHAQERDPGEGAGPVAAPSEPLSAESAPGTPEALPQAVEPAPPATDPAPLAADSAPPDSAPPPEEKVRGTVVRAKSASSRRLVRSAEAVDVVDTSEAQGRSEDLAEVLTRQSAVQVQRTGGLGSNTQISLAGLAGDQVRLLLDGIPLDYSPFVVGLGNVPVSFIQQMEVFNGVVPVRLATDALGGAIHLRSDLIPPETGASFTLQSGSFDSYRGTARLSWLAPERHFYARAVGFHDRSRNDYLMTAEVSGAMGRVESREVYRRHDAYLASGVNLEAGVLDLPWADRLAAHAYFAQYDKEIPHNPVMTTPYGEVTTRRRSLGLTLQYTAPPTERLGLWATAGFNRRLSELSDVSTCTYDWYGNCVSERLNGGEISGLPQELFTRFDTAFARVRGAVSTWAPEDLEFSLAFDQSWRTGRNDYLQRFGYYDAAAVPIAMGSGIAGVSHRQRLFEESLENVVFAKGYLQLARIGEDTRSAVTSHERTSVAAGVGDTLRFALTRQLSLKASYEYTTRLPRADELFGDGAFLLENLELAPERSHNGNVAVELTPLVTPAGVFSANLLGGVRSVQDLIVLIAGNQTQRYESVGQARALTLHGGFEWTSPGRWLSLGANATVNDYRNLSETGAFARFNGDRLPYRPWFQASGALTVRMPELVATGDALSLTWNTRYVHTFFRSWESAGLASSKKPVPSQLVHSASLHYRLPAARHAFTASLSIDNLSDAAVFDVIGVQKPGRAVFGKFSVDL
ncbi:TonB-dependent receptor [Archangium violaceum]|uniref:TonB-dependent receptor domain-containing protein n=1 Tax=Archangium violaceum TaxID=83451 RepID=UPI002B30C6E9|nr:TonB-dependent receptor [Archangium gephyra]